MAKAVEPRGRPGVVPRRDDLHRRDLQKPRETHLRQRGCAPGPSQALQLQDRGKRKARARHPSGGGGRRGRVQGARPCRGRPQYIRRKGKAKAREVGDGSGPKKAVKASASSQGVRLLPTDRRKLVKRE